MLASRPNGRVTTGPFFLADRFSVFDNHQASGASQGKYRTQMSWQETVTQTVTGLGFDLVDLERSAGGLLRVTIDLPWVPPVEGQA